MCLSAGMDGYLTKPIKPDALYAALDEVGAAAPREPPLVDWSAALERAGGQQDVLRTLIELYFQECARLLPEVRRAVEWKDGPALRRAAHTLRGAADCFGAREAVRAAERLELMGRDGEWSAGAEATAALERELARLTPVLKAHHESHE
jgi:HPt (histidine-containing phosphotransfer) domain-containing protein